MARVGLYGCHIAVGQIRERLYPSSSGVGLGAVDLG